ncbi:MAG TPA: hypothetical protein VFU82_01600 [Gammaproteobacteria bacterium]|nr:hypothetical protein [Gammaproteobacteria bacterium]
MNAASQSQGRQWPIYLVAGIISIVLSIWVSAREVVINPDGICYLLSAEAYQVFTTSQVMQLCAQAGWPFYSWLIHIFMTLTGFSSLVSANVLDAVFSLISVLAFMRLTQVLGGGKRVLVFAAFVILLSHEFNSARQYIVRDHGYWAFYLVSLLFFVRCLEQLTARNVLAFAGALLMATLFRIEGAVFFMLLPFAALFLPKQASRIRLSLALFSPCLFGFVAVLGVALFYPNHLTQSGRLFELGQYLTQSGAQMLAQFNASKSALMASVLPLEAARDAGLVWFLTLIQWYFVNIIQNVSLIFAILLVYAWKTRAASWAPKHRLAVVAYVLVNVIITAIFFAQHLFLSKRYLIALTLTLSLWVPFALEKLFVARAGRPSRVAYAAAMFFIVLSSLGVILNSGPSKAYLRDAGDWLAVNVPAKSSLFINDGQLMYYAKHNGLDLFKASASMRDPAALANGQWHHYDYVALRVRGDDARWAAVAIGMNQQPMRTYSGPHGDAILIYKTGS